MPYTSTIRPKFSYPDGGRIGIGREERMDYFSCCYERNLTSYYVTNNNWICSLECAGLLFHGESLTGLKRVDVIDGVPQERPLTSDEIRKLNYQILSQRIRALFQYSDEERRVWDGRPVTQEGLN